MTNVLTNVLTPCNDTHMNTTATAALRVHRPTGRVIHAASKAQVFGAPIGYMTVVTKCGRDMGLDYSEVACTTPITCRACRATLTVREENS